MTAQQLKNSILQLAVQGKLVPQDPNDEPASILLERIRAEKEQLIKDGKLKKEKPLPPITEDDIPFDVPDSWKWVRLEMLSVNIHYGYTASASEIGNAKLLRITDIQDNIVQWETVPFCSPSDREFSVYGLQNRDIMIARTGGTIGKSYIVRNLSERAVFASYLIRVIPFRAVYEEYIKIFLETPLYWEQLKERSMGTGQPNVNGQSLKALVLPLPPLAEQHRIVERIGELLPHISDYDATEQKLTTLNATFPGQLMKSILQAAVQGKLVPQDEDDEPASVMLERIGADKEQLIKDGKLKKEKPMPPIAEDEIPFDVPESWAWVRLGTLMYKLTDGAHQTPNYTESGVPFLSVKDISSGNISFNNTKFISPEEHSELYKRCDPERGDILLTKVGTTGIPVLVDTDKEFSLFVSVALLKFNQNLLSGKYLVKLLESPLVGMQCAKNTRGVGNKNWVIRDIANTLVVLPPLAEQRRIVAKCEELMLLVENLGGKV